MTNCEQVLNFLSTTKTTKLLSTIANVLYLFDKFCINKVGCMFSDICRLCFGVVFLDEEIGTEAWYS